MRRARGSRQTETSAPVARAASASRGSSAARLLACASARSAAAASDEPPPRPAATGRCLISVNRPNRKPGTRSPSARAARCTRLSSFGPAASAVGPDHFEPERRLWIETQAIADAREGDNTVELVVTVVSPPENVQRQINFGGGAPERDRHGAASPYPPVFVGAGLGLAPASGPEVPSGRPFLIFSRIRGSSSGSGPKSRAWFHWKCASVLRSTRQ